MSPLRSGFCTHIGHREYFAQIEPINKEITLLDIVIHMIKLLWTNITDDEHRRNNNNIKK